MTRLKPAKIDEISEESKKIWIEHQTKYNRVTNMKKTLAHSAPAFASLMSWYTLYEESLKFLSKEDIYLFCQSISQNSECQICSLFFKRLLSQANIEIEDFQASTIQKVLIKYGEEVSKNHYKVSPQTFSEIARLFNSEQIIVLTALAGLMIATNLFNNALEVELDEYLWEFQQKGE